MRKRMLSWGLILSLLLTMLPVSAMAAESGEPEAEPTETIYTLSPDTEIHSANTLTSTGTADHSNHTGWTPLSGTISSNSFYQGGNYYLNDNRTTYSDITINFDVTLCLNSNTLNIGQNTTFTVSSGATLTICDCQSGGTITGTESYINLNVISVEGGTLNLESGTISSTAAHSGSLISVTDGDLNVTGGTISLNHTGSGAYDGVQAVELSNSTGSFTGGEVHLTTAVDNNRATTVYQEGGSVTVGGSAEISFKTKEDSITPGCAALCVTSSGQATINTGCTITASRTDGGMKGAVSIGMLNDATGTATITGGDINGFLVVYGTADISNGSFDYIENRGTLTMTGGTVENENEYGIDYGIWTSGATTLGNVSITAPTGIYVSQGRPTIGDGVTINATQYGVDGSATLVGTPVIEGGTADLYIYSMRATTDYPSVDATAYTGDALTVQERKFPDAHQGGYIGCAIKVKESDKDKFQFTNSDGNFVYQYDEASGALRLYNQNAHPICGASCDHGDASHNDPAWQKWSTPSNYTLTGGSYYLTSTVTLGQAITVTGDVNLCLNGNTIKRSDGSSPFQVTDGSLTICDCKDTGQLIGGITATGGHISIYGGTLSGGAYAVDLGGSAKLTLAGSPALSGTSAALKLYTQSGTTLENAAVDATDYTGGSLAVEENDVPGGANGFAIKGGENKFSLTNLSTGYHYAYEGGYVIRPDHTHSYTYSGSGAVITETCTCNHSATATLSIRSDADLTYTGNAIEPAEVTYSEDWQGGNLTPAYENNINAGTATATITKDNATASVTFTIEKASQTAPAANEGYTIDYANETITVNGGYEIYTAEDGGTAVQTGATVTPGTTYYIRREGDNNHYPSDFTPFTVTARPAAPGVTAVAETIKGKGDGKVTGVDTTMEYSTDGGQNWMPCTGTEITGLAAGTTVIVRVKATATTPHGEVASCTIDASENTLTVTFEENGGSAVPDITGLSYNATISAPAAPTKTGYAFGGWYKEAACTNLWDFSTDTVTKDITLYAQWTLGAPTVALTADKTDVIYGETITLTATVSQSGGDLTYSWYKGSEKLSGDDETLTLSNVADSGSYTVKVTATSGDGQQTTAEASITVSITPAPVEIPAPSDTKFIYNGQEQTYPIADNTRYTVTGNQQTNAGDYTVTVSLNDKDNYTWADGNAEDRTYSFTIAPKTITATWSGLTQVYDTTEQVKATLSGIVPDDDVTVSIAGVAQTAGSHPLTATLTGDDTDNYTLKNGTEILTIRPKTVGFTVSGNAVEGDGTAKTATVAPTDNALTQTDYTVTYRQGTATVAAPTAVGSYEIWVEITDGNYQHTNGKAEMQVGTLTITQAPPMLYAVTFAGGQEATGTAPDALSAVENAKIILPACTFEREDYLFTGWSDSGKIYQPGDSFTMPAQDVTFTAQWQQTYGITVTVQEPKPEGGDMQTVSDAVVSLWLGANKLDEQTTIADGTYTFADLLPGIYNLVVTKDDRTVTSMVEITEENVACIATLPKGATNSIVKVTEGSPDIVVGNLNTVFHQEPDDTVYTKDDQKTVIDGGKIEVTFTAEEKQKTEVSEDLQKIQAVSGDSNLALVMDYKLEKEVFDAEGTKIAEDTITRSNVLLEIRLPLPAELQGKADYAVYRVHNNVAEAMKANPSSDEEGFKVEGSYITIYAQKFSIYAIGYTEAGGNNNNNNQTSGGGGGGGGSTPTYSPSIVQPEHGTVTASPKNPQKGDKVTIAITPENGYTVDTVTVTDINGKIVEVTPNNDGTYTFVQPSGKVTITVTFRQTTDTSDCPGDESCPMAAFTDADRSAWYHDGIHYCVEQGLMVGTSETAFSPNSATTRGMIVTILWRLEGSPLVSTSLNYDDVKPEDWYGEAVRWADDAGVVTGYGNGKFGPNDPITREQMAAMLWRYAGSAKVNGILPSFADGAQISSWAQPAMIWAVEQGLITGVGNDRLEPSGQATRAQAATILMRFAQDKAQ